MRETSNTLSKQNSQQPKQFRGGEKKVMKKSLSLLVAIAMVFSMFATVVSAAGPEEGQSAGQYLNQLGVIKGNGTDLKEDQTWKRQDIVVLLSRLLGVEAAAKATAKSHEFKDVTDKNYDGYISWAVEEGLVQGKGNGKFGYGDELKTQEFYALVLRAFKVEVAYDEVPAKAVEMKLAAEGTDFSAVPTRGATYSTIVTALNTEVPGTGKTLGEALGLIEGAAVSATQTGAKLVTVKFNKAVDTEKAKFVVKNAGSTREVAKTTFSEDKKSAVLEFSTKLLDGASSVTVSGLGDTELVSDFTAAAEKITEIVFTSDKLALGTKTTGSNPNAADYENVSVGYKIVNQYDEDVTKTSGGSLQFQVGKANATANATNGVLKITSSNNTTFQIGETVFVNGILNMGTYAITTPKTFTIGLQAVVDTVDILSVYHPDNKEITTSSTFEDYYVLVDAKDQYGSNVTAEQFKNGVFTFVSNQNLFAINKDDVRANVGPNRDKLGIRLTSPTKTPGFVFEGTNKITITSLMGQKSDTLDVVVKKAPTLNTISLTQPTETVVPNAVIKVPFEAYDQNGAKLEKFADVNGMLSLSTNNGEFKVVQDYTNKKAVLEWTVGSATGDAYLTANVVNTASNSQLPVKVVAKDDPRALAGLKDVKTAVLVGSTVEIEPKHIVVKDQFDRNMKLEDLLATHSVTISVYEGQYNKDPLVVVNGNTTADKINLTNTNKKVVLKAVEKGTATVKLTLKKLDGTEVATHNTFAITVIDNKAIVSDSYQVADITKVHASDVSRGAEVKVTGKLSNGTEVTLPQSAYTVTAVGDLKYDEASNKVYAGDVFNGSTDKTKTAKATYIVHILETNAPISKEVTIVNETPVPTKLESKDFGTLKSSDLVVKGGATAVTVANVFATLKAKDQFGADVATLVAGTFTASISELDGVTVTNNGKTVDQVSVQGLAIGKGYTVTFTSAESGQQIKLKVVADAN